MDQIRLHPPSWRLQLKPYQNNNNNNNNNNNVFINLFDYLSSYEKFIEFVRLYTTNVFQQLDIIFYSLVKYTHAWSGLLSEKIYGYKG